MLTATGMPAWGKARTSARCGCAPVAWCPALAVWHAARSRTASPPCIFRLTRAHVVTGGMKQDSKRGHHTHRLHSHSPKRQPQRQGGRSSDCRTTSSACLLAFSSAPFQLSTMVKEEAGPSGCAPRPAVSCSVQQSSNDGGNVDAVAGSPRRRAQRRTSPRPFWTGSRPPTASWWMMRSATTTPSSACTPTRWRRCSCFAATRSCSRCGHLTAAARRDRGASARAAAPVKRAWPVGNCAFGVHARRAAEVARRSLKRESCCAGQEAARHSVHRARGGELRRAQNSHEQGRALKPARSARGRGHRALGASPGPEPQALAAGAAQCSTAHK